MMAVIRQKCDETHPAAADDWPTLPQDRGQQDYDATLIQFLNHWTNVSVWDPIISPHADHTPSQGVSLYKQI